MEAEQNCHESRHLFENRSSIDEKATDMSGGCAEQDEDREKPRTKATDRADTCLNLSLAGSLAAGAPVPDTKAR